MMTTGKIYWLGLAMFLCCLPIPARDSVSLSSADEKALRTYREMAALEPDAAEAWLVQQVRKKPTAPLLFELAALRYAQKKYAAAAGRFGEVLDLAPDFPDARRNQGQALILAGRHQEGIGVLQKEVQSRAMDARLALLLGDAYLQLEEPVAAESCLRIAVIGYPENLELRLSLALALYRQQRFTASAAVVWEVLKIDPSLADAWTLLANCRMQGQEPARAIDALEAAVRLAPKQEPRRWLTLGDLYLAEQLPDAAAAAYQQAAGNGELRVSRRLALAQSLFDLGAWRRASEMLNQIPASARRDDVEAQTLLGRIARERGNWQRARKHFEKALEKAPLRGDLLLAMGDVAWELKEPLKAVSYYRTARQSGKWRLPSLEAELAIHLEHRDHERALDVLDLLQKEDPQPYWQELRQELQQAR